MSECEECEECVEPTVRFAVHITFFKSCPFFLMKRVFIIDILRQLCYCPKKCVARMFASAMSVDASLASGLTLCRLQPRSHSYSQLVLALKGLMSLLLL
jgi:hypothetical protein